MVKSKEFYRNLFVEPMMKIEIKKRRENDA